METVRLPPGAEFYIALQRPPYAWRQGRRLRLGHELYVRHFMRMVERRRRDKIARAFTEGLERDLESLRPFLPERASRLLDIGCGLGGIDILLYHHYAPDPPTVALLDRDGLSEELFYGYRSEAAHYTSLEGARRLLEDNGVAPDAITTWDPDVDGYPRERSFDLIVSIISWGFHYPIDAYLDDVRATLADGGTLILDVQKDTDAEPKLGEVGDVEVIETSRWRRRLCVRR